MTKDYLKGFQEGYNVAYGGVMADLRRRAQATDSLVQRAVYAILIECFSSGEHLDDLPYFRDRLLEVYAYEQRMEKARDEKEKFDA